MALQFLRYPEAQVFIFDKGGSALASTLGVGGTYHEVGGKNATHRLVFQPLAHVNDYHERVWATDWILGLLKQSDLPVDPSMREAVWSALESLASLPEHQRTMTGFCALVQNTLVRQAVQLYTLEGPYGEIFDAEGSSQTDQSWQCFEMEVLMQMPETVAPALAVIFHRIEKQFDGRPTLLILDEAWLFLSHPLFAAKIREWLKTLRKQNVSVIFATQSVDDALNSTLSSALLESCPSRVFLPNDRALEPSVSAAYQALGLNEKQTQMVAHAIPKRQYYFQSSFGNALFDLALGPVALAFAGASQPDRKKLLWSLHDKYPASADFVPHYLKAIHMDWANEILKAYPGKRGEHAQ
jgi:type IV secretion system protein TrbE